MNSSPALEVEDLRVRYGTDIALEDVFFQVNPGERIAVVGPNGAGKSTLLQAVAGLLPASRGKIHFTGEQRNGPIAFLPQRPSIDWKFPLTVLDAVALGLKIKGRGAARKAAADALELVRLSEHAQRRISHLSGGQQQRLLIARALAMRSDLLLMDEPLSGLDSPARDNLFECLDDLRDHKVAVLMALHDLNLASTLFQRAILLNRKIIADGNPVDIFTETNLVRTYGSHLHVVRINGGTVLISDTCCEGRNE